jgi:hypothetical protein
MKRVAHGEPKTNALTGSVRAFFFGGIEIAVPGPLSTKGNVRSL